MNPAPAAPVGALSAADSLEAALSSVLLSTDPFAQEAAVDYWQMSAPAHEAVVGRLRACAPQLAPILQELATAPHHPGLAARCRAVLAALAEQEPAAWAEVAVAAARADGLGRLAAFRGARCQIDEAPVRPEHLPPPGAPGGAAASGAAASRAAAAAPVAVVIPFRDRTAQRSRLRNLLACLAALADQSVDRAAYRVVLVEADSEPRWQAAVRDRVDQYAHLDCPGHFNKAWAVNAGVVQHGGAAEVICVLDADVLVDREFIARNLARFAGRGAQAHLPFRDALCLTPPASDRAVRERVLAGAPAVPQEVLCGVLLRRPPGHCVWVRRDLFDRVGGLDERFEGWGGEDLDFVFRLDVVGAVDRYGDPLLHLWHTRPQTEVAGKRFYAGRRLLSWRPLGPIGQPEGPAESADDDLAGLIEREGSGAQAHPEERQR